MRLDGKVAAVTGAATGFGAGIARRFAGEGARVIVAGIDDSAGRDVAGKSSRRSRQSASAPRRTLPVWRRFCAPAKRGS